MISTKTINNKRLTALFCFSKSRDESCRCTKLAGLKYYVLSILLYQLFIFDFISIV